MRTSAALRQFAGRRSGREPVSVAELIRRQGGTHTDLPEPEEEAAEQQPPDTGIGSGSRALRIGGSVLGLVLLLAATAVVSTTLSRHPTGSPVPLSGAGTAGITGGEALRPDLLLSRAGRLGPERITGAAPVPAMPDFPQQGVRLPGTGESELSVEDLVRPDPSSLLLANPSAGSAESAIDVVSRFYRLLDRSPRRAVALLSPRLAGDDREAIARAWRPLDSVRARSVSTGDDGEIHAVVGAETADGGRLVLRHTFTVSDGSRPRIRTARLRSARFSPS